MVATDRIAAAARTRLAVRRTELLALCESPNIYEVSIKFSFQPKCTFAPLFIQFLPCEL